MKQTAVEFLFEQFFKVKWDDIPNKPIMFEQAKSMEKEQIMDAYQKGFTRELGNRNEDFEQYYNETFK